MAEQFNPLGTPFLANRGAWSVSATDYQLRTVCRKACRCLQAILRDANRLDTTAANLNTQSILHLLEYYRQALHEVFNLPNATEDYRQEYTDFSNELGRFRQRAPNGTFNQPPRQIPSSTATELLLRLLLEKAPRLEDGNPTITSIDELVVAWNRKCRNTSGIVGSDSRGLPRILMICAGHNHSYSFVFATTAAAWGAYESIQNWCRDARAARLNPIELGNHTARYTAFHNSVGLRLPQDLQRMSGAQQTAIRDAARRTAIENMPNTDKYNHNGELARSIEIQPVTIENPRNPNFLYAMQQRSRCYKCQVLYRWFVHNEVPTLADGTFAEQSCAEYVCNFFCNRVNPRPTFVAIAAPANNAPPVNRNPGQTTTAPYWPPNWNGQRPWNLLQNNQAMDARAWQAV